MDYGNVKGKRKCVCSSSGSTASSSSRSSNGTLNKHGFRTVHLKRQVGMYIEANGKTNDTLFASIRPNSFGFSFRGGREFGTGFFISAVEQGSEAHYKGLKVGDQIIRINGLSVEDATHQEMVQLAQAHHQITLTVKSVGIIPVKDKCEDPLTWKLVDQPVEDHPLVSGCGDIDRILIDIPENAQLGCGICKGPDWRPGIFVQYTKPNSLARRCGLQPGDQILQCNRISFLQIDFTYAVSVLKNLRTLDLVLKKGSGIDLFPGESSGYSSSSSVADEAVSHPTALSKRLSIVTEESEDRHQRKSCHCKASKHSLKSSASIDSIFDNYQNGSDVPSYRERSKSIEILTDSNFKNTVTFRNHENVSRTFVNASKGRETCRCIYGSQTVIKVESNDVIREVATSPSMSSEEHVDQGRISVEVHRTDDKSPPDKVPIEKSPSSSSFSSGCSLSSAISQEIQRRNERKMKGLGMRSERAQLLKPADKQQRQQHDMLIAELKKKQGWEEKTSTVSTQTLEATPPSSSRTRQRNSDGDSNSHSIEHPKLKPVDTKSRSASLKPLIFPPVPEDSPPACPTPDYYSDNSLTDQSIETSQIVKNSILKFEEKHKTPHLPNPVQKTVTFGQNSTKEITPIKNLVRTLRNGESENPILLRHPYAMSEKKIQDLVEMQSIESYDLTEPKQVAPKPPPVYFQPPNRSDLKETEPKKRTTVIKITEYPTEKRREPVKFDFLNQNNEKDKAFESELASTLSRSNLRNKIDAFTNKSNSSAVAPKNGVEKVTTVVNRYNGYHPTPVIPTEITENQISTVKKTLKTFEKNTSNTVIVKIPKRN